ncbi:MAG: outer membrane lipoprotein-sorting protein [Synergistales bacterium]|nr:outer membrane lipoprotein-sorting protein [Synergistales bacterium]
MTKAFLFFSLIIICLMPTECLSNDLTGEEIIIKVNELLNQDSAFSRSRMTIQTSSGQFRTFEFLTWAKDKGEKNLIRYTEPPRAQGQAVLMLNNADDIWMYFPRTKRVRKLATHAKKQKIQGSDFSYEDMGSGDTFLTDFRPFRLEDDVFGEHSCFRVQLDRKPGIDSAYLKIIMWVRKEDFFPLSIHYYEEDYPDTLSKSMLLGDIRIIQGVPTAMKMTMKDNLDFTETTMELLEIDYELKIEDSRFTERALRE